MIRLLCVCVCMCVSADEEGSDVFGQGSPHGSLFSQGSTHSAHAVVSKPTAGPSESEDVEGEVRALVHRMAGATAALTDIAAGGPPADLLKESFLSVLVAKNTVTLQSPDGFTGTQLVGAVSEWESESKADVTESDTKSPGGEGGHPYVPITLPDADSVRVALGSASKLPPGLGLYVKGSGGGDTLLLPSMGTKALTIESMHPYVHCVCVCVCVPACSRVFT